MTRHSFLAFLVGVAVFTASSQTGLARVPVRSPVAADIAGVPSGVSTSDWSSIREAHEATRYFARPIDGGYRAQNPGQQWTTTFDGRGFTTTPDSGVWSWGLELVSFGWGENQYAVTAPHGVNAERQRVAYAWDDRLTEWYVNGTRGLEHGFTVRERPAGGHGTGPLTISLAVRGELEPTIDGDGRAARFASADGGIALHYAGLTVFDADGRSIPARLELADGGIAFSIDERSARYPITIDPIAQQAYLKASNTASGPFFGTSVAISGDTVVVGAEYEASNATGVNGNGSNYSAPGAGAAYVFVRSGTSWIQQAYLKASNTGADDGFGHSVAISGDTIVVGAVYEASNATGVNGNGSDNSMYGAGAVYVFVRSGTSWSQQAYLKASNPGLEDYFGYSVAVSGDTVVVGSSFEASNATGVNGNQADNSAAGAGAAYVFVRSGTSWSQEAYLKASNTAALDVFGSSVSVSADTVVVGAYAEDSSAKGVNGNQADNSAKDAGAAYVFVRSGTTWSQQAYLKASNTDPMDAFGFSVAVGGDTLAVGSPFERSSVTGVNGHQSDNSAPFAGAVYMFVRSGTSWSQQAYLKASNTSPDDVFGTSVSVAADIVVCGAHGEDSAATGVNGDGTNNAALSAGAAYVFRRSGTSWSQDSYLKSSNADSGDLFGVSVSISGETVVVGALYEDSSATGVNGNQGNGSTECGAAYVFDVCSSTASATAYGAGKPGTTGVPVLSSTSPTLGTVSTVTISGGLPGASPVLLLAGFAPSALAFDGGMLLVTPTFLVALPPLNASGALALPSPLTTWVCGLSLYLQAMYADPGAAGFYHTAQTNALAWTFGG